MGTIILYLTLGVNALVSLRKPWIGIVLAFFVAILTPQNIWWWAFQDTRPLLWVLLPTLLGLCLAILTGNINYSGLNTKLNWWVVIFWATLTLSYYAGPYVNVVNEYRFYDPPFMFSSVQKTFLTYFAAVLLLDNVHKIKWVALVLVVTVVYMTYWANARYFVDGAFGRIGGPVPLSGYSIYSDENIFAVLFIVGVPFIYYFAEYLQSRLVKWAAWLIIPFSWHAVFLTASRGALLATVVVLALYAIRSKSKILGLLVIVTFVGAFAWQAGDVMKNRSTTIVDYEEDQSASGRIEAWKAATKMMISHPFTGVGFVSFGQAFPNYSDARPRIAHNTFFQVAGEQGVLGGLSYLIFTFIALNRLRKNGARLAVIPQKTDSERLLYCLNESCFLGFAGFSICAIFLSLANYDLFYCLLVLSNRTLLDSEALFPHTADQPSEH